MSARNQETGETEKLKPYFMSTYVYPCTHTNTCTSLAAAEGGKARAHLDEFLADAALPTLRVAVDDAVDPGTHVRGVVKVPETKKCTEGRIQFMVKS